MTDQEFQSALSNFKLYLKPQMFSVLLDNSDIFSDKTKQEIIEKLQEADNQMKELYEYRAERNGIVKQGLVKIDKVYSNVKARFQQSIEKEKALEVIQAEKLISDI